MQCKKHGSFLLNVAGQWSPLAATNRTFKRVRLGLRFFQSDDFFAEKPRLSWKKHQLNYLPTKNRISIKKDKSAFHGSFWHFDAFGFGFSYKTLDYIYFGLFWNNPRGAQIGTPVPAGGLRKQARCCPSQALDPGATSESWCFEFWPSWDTSSQIFTTGKSLALFLFVRVFFHSVFRVLKNSFIDVPSLATNLCKMLFAL